MNHTYQDGCTEGVKSSWPIKFYNEPLVKMYGLFFGSPEELYLASTNLDKLEQKKKDLEVLYDLAVSYKSHVDKTINKAYTQYIYEYITLKLDYNESRSKYTNIANKLIFNDKNIRFSNIVIKEINVI